MDTIELFSGTKSFSKVMQKQGHSTLTIDNNIRLDPDICQDINDFFFICEYDILWASPPCTAFSVAAIGKNWDNNKQPKSDKAILGLKLLDKTIQLIAVNKPKYWFIENPRGMMRVVIDDIFKKYNITNYKMVTVTYCQYGDNRMKPTDIWTNLKGWDGKRCYNRMTCHESAPRGFKTGTQGLKNAKDRGVIPPKLFEEILEVINNDKQN